MLHCRVLKILDFFKIAKSKCAKEFNVTHKTFVGYLKQENQHHLWQYLPFFLEWNPEISRNWLYFGEGEMLDKEKKEVLSQAIPLIGFADCGVQGWHGAMSIPVTVSAPTWHDKMIACMASGESMLPSGIGNGHICYCDPTLEPVIGEPVYVEQRQGIATLKIFCGRTERQGKQYIDLKGWLDKENEHTVQKEFHMNVLSSQIKQIAPVIYVRRRL